MEKEQLIEFYIEQYRETSRKNKKRNVNGKHYQHRINAKAKSLERAVASPNQGIAVTLLHQDVKKLAFLILIIRGQFEPSIKELFRM